MALRTDGDAYIAVHADTGPYRRELGPEVEAASAAAGKRSGDRYAREFNASLLGRLKGSRNDFLNIVGTIGEFVERLSARVVFGGIDRLGQAMASLGTRLLQTEGPLSGFGVLLGMVGQRIQGLGAGGIDGLIVQIAALSIAMQASVAVAGVFAAGLSVLTAAAVALTVSLGGALLGGLTLLGPVLAGAAVGAAALALAFSDLDDAQKAVFDPLKNLFNETRDAVQGALFQDMGSQIERVVGILSPFKDVLVDVANATREWFSRTLEAFDPNGPLGASLATLGQTLPGIFTGVLDLLTNLGTSLTGLFAAASPAAQTFLDKINGVVAQFSAWVNSAEGQETINNFLNTALGLLGQLWDIAKEVGTALGILFTEGNATGSTFLTKIQEIVANFNTWLTDQGGREALSKWFADSVVAIEKVGGVLDSLIKLFDTLDNEQTREAFNFILDALADIIGWIDLNKQTFDSWVKAIANGAVTVVAWFGHIINIISGARDKFDELAQRAKDKLGVIINVVQSLPGLISAAFGFAGGILRRAGEEVVDGLRNGIASAAQGVLNYISTLASRISKAFKDALGIKSPSTVFAGFGRNISEGLAIGITEASGLVTDAMSGLTSNLNTPISALGGGGNSTSTTSTSGGLTLSEGAIVVNSPFANGRLVALDVMDALAVRGK